MENFDNILSLGFRGEALPSIAAVSNLKIKSNTKNNENGNAIELNAGKIISKKPTNQKKGTFINVKDLFFSTPARLKFLKSENYESLLIKRTVKKLAMCNYNIIFNLNVNHKDVLKTKKVEETSDQTQLKNRVTEVLGNEFIENSIFFDEQRDNFRFFGFLGVPTYHHSNTNNQYIFVNKRIVQDKSLNVIFKLAYRDFISYDRFPQFICFIECPSEDIDVNVHPAKNEVRFKDVKTLNSNIINCVKENLKKVMHFASTVNTDRAINKFSKSVSQNTLKLAETTDVEFTPFPMKGENQEQNQDSEKKEFPLGYAKSQFHNTYIISQTDNGIVVVDQHAAHERIVYERLKNQIYNNEIKTQLLLIPVVIDIEKSSLNVILNSLETVKKFGVNIEPFGNDSIVVREVPSILSDCDIKNLTLDIIDDLIESKDSKLVEERINRICSKMACHGSIRAGREMQINEMNDLLRRMEATPFSGQCNHGRPTYVELKLNDIEKLFGRK